MDWQRDGKLDKKHQIVLLYNHHVTQLFARQEHIIQLQTGPQAFVYAITQKFGP
jgi:hypothetical protein